jgi:tRNA pseudouridine55 synthase
MSAAPAPSRPASRDGILVIDKPEGPTSHDVVTAARRLLGVREVGHTGTLDPMATGVLALVIGRATRLAPFFAGREKTYEARIRLGVATDSWDRTGEVVAQQPPGAPMPAPDDVVRAAESFLGEQDQTPPPFSAKRVDGVRAYRLARQGRDVAVKPARVTLHSVTVRATALPFVDLSLVCSSGFYVRALADALGSRLGCGACLEALRRTASGDLTLASAVTVEALARDSEAALSQMIPLDRALPAMPAVVLTEAGVRRALHGNDVGPGDVAAGGIAEPGPDDHQPPGQPAAVRLVDAAGRLLAIARPAAAPGVLHPAVVLK